MVMPVQLKVVYNCLAPPEQVLQSDWLSDLSVMLQR